MLPYQILATWKNIKKPNNNNKSKKSTLLLNHKFELPNEPFSVSDIQDYFENIIKIHESQTDNPPVRIYLSKFENRITFKIK